MSQKRGLLMGWQLHEGSLDRIGLCSTLVRCLLQLFSFCLEFQCLPGDESHCWWEQHIIEISTPTRDNSCQNRNKHKASSIVIVLFYPSHSLFTLLVYGRRYLSTHFTTNRLSKSLPSTNMDQSNTSYRHMVISEPTPALYEALSLSCHGTWSSFLPNLYLNLHFTQQLTYNCFFFHPTLHSCPV